MDIEDRIELMKHRDFIKKKHSKNCKCGYCELKRINKNIVFQDILKKFTSD